MTTPAPVPDQDEALLVDMLGLLDESVLDQGALTLSPSSSRSLTSETSASSPERATNRVAKQDISIASTPRKKTRCGPRHNKQKDEITSLRKVVRELEQHLRTLRERSIGSSHDDLGARLWAGIASKQLTERKRVERENNRLRAEVDERTQLLQRLEKLAFRRRSTTELLSWFQSLEASQCMRRTQRLNVASVVVDLKRTLDHMYLQVDSIVDMMRLKATRKGEVELATEMVVDQRRQPVITEHEARVLPVDYRVAADAMWSLLHHRPTYNSNKRIFQEQADVTEVSITSSFEGRVDLPKHSGHFRVKYVSQRFEEQDRIVILGSALMDPLQVNDKPISGVCVRSQLWYILEPSSSCTSRQPATIHHTYGKVSVEMFDAEVAPSTRHHEVEALTSFMLRKAQLHPSLHHQMLENRMLERRPQVA